MLISCPSCRTDYEIADDALPAEGRRARCSACGAVWLATPETLSNSGSDLAAGELRGTIEFDGPSAPAGEPLPVEPLYGVSPKVQPAKVEPEAAAEVEAASAGIEPEEPAPAPVGRSGRLRKRRSKPPMSGKKKRNLLIAAGIAAAIAIPALLLHQRMAVVRLLPQVAGVYSAIGWPVNIRGIDIVNVASRIVEDEGSRLLVVEGELVGLARHAVDVPRLRFAVRDSKGAEIYAWTAPADRNRLNPGERMVFRRRLASPPAEGLEVSVRFVNRLDIVAGLN